MIEITKENLNGLNFVDKHKPKHLKDSFMLSVIKENKLMKYFFGIAGIFTIINMVLIYNFFKILIKM